MAKTHNDEMWKKLERSLIPYTDNPREAASYIKDLYSIYDKNCMTWLGGLFDARLGGFYYSNSARDGQQFFPDLESTGQAVAILETSGVISTYTDIPEWIRTSIASFICFCEDENSGYFYNPQWPKDEVDKKLSRRARDTTWAIETAQKLNFDIPYLSIISNINNRSSSVPWFLKSEIAFKKFIDSLDWEKGIYGNISMLANNSKQIISAGLGSIALEFVDSLRDKNTGLWGEGVLTKDKQLKTAAAALYFYSDMNVVISEPMKMFDFVIDSFDSIEPREISDICNRFFLVGLLISSLIENGKAGYTGLVREMISKFIESFPYTIPKTIEQLLLFKKPDGSFSYLKTSPSPISQAMLVSEPNTYEGDINATYAAMAMVKRLVKILSLNNVDIPLFSNEEIKTFEKAAKNMKH